MLTRRAWFLVGTLWMGMPGCGESSEGDNTQTAVDPASASEEDDPLAGGANAFGDAGVMEAPSVQTDAGAFAGEDASIETAFRIICEETCAAHSECVGLSDVQCVDDCSAQAAALASNTCLAEGLDELRCLGTLTCDELWAYGTIGRRDHPTCGAQADAYFTACTVGSGKPPAACEAMCARFSGCDALQARTLRACQETCVLRATWAVWTVGVECGDAFLAVAGCVAEASCADVTELQTLGTIPPFCVTLEAARDAACN